MAHYIDADRLRAEINRLIADPTLCSTTERKIGGHTALLKLVSFLDSLQQEQPDNLVQTAKVFLDELSKTPYNNTPITEAQIIIKELILFFENPASYEPNAINQGQPNKESLNESQQEFVNIVTERMLKEGPIPTLKGKQKAKFEKEFNRFKQITGMINFPAYMEVYKKVILWFMAWSADNLPNLNKAANPDELDSPKEQPKFNIPSDGSGAMGEIPPKFKLDVKPVEPEVDLEKLGEIARHIIAVKQNVEDMRLNEDEWSLLERIGYPHKLNARKK